MRWELELSPALNTEGFEAQVIGMYFPIDYVGFKLGIGIAGEMDLVGDLLDDTDDYYYDPYDYYVSRLKISAGFVLRSPRLFYWESTDLGFHLFTEPAIVYSPGISGHDNAQVLCWDLRTGINMQYNRYVFSIGYGISNFYLYSNSRSNLWMPSAHSNEMTHSIFVGVAIKF